MKVYTFNLFYLVLGFLLYVGCASSGANRKALNPGKPWRESLRKERRDFRTRPVLYGKASYYGREFHGKNTASGEKFDMHALTAAHRNLPFGTLCKVTNLKNGKSVVVRINDRGPFVEDRVLDLSYGAAKKLDALQEGVIEVKIEVLKLGKENN